MSKWKGQPWAHPYHPLSPICSWKSLRKEHWSQHHYVQGCGLGMWMIPLFSGHSMMNKSSTRSSNTSIPSNQPFNLQWKRRRTEGLPSWMSWWKGEKGGSQLEYTERTHIQIDISTIPRTTTQVPRPESSHV